MTRELTLLATLGSEAQVVTLTLDALLQRGESIRRIVIIHTAPDSEPIGGALTRLLTELHSSYYPASFQIQTLMLVGPRGPLTDVDSTDDAAAAFTTLYRAVRAEKLAGRRVHLSIAGGRKTLAVFGMAVAQLLFDADDRLSHLVSQGALLAEKRMHAAPGDECHLIEIPVLLWRAVSPVLTDLSGIEDPFVAVERQRALRLQETLDEARSFVLGSLSGAEQRVVELLVRESLSDHELAERLALSPRTVEQHLRSAYRKAAAHWALAEVNRTQLVRLLALYYALRPAPAKNTGNPA
ncbi:MAG: CRISPR-associated ring nuclease [Anaerolineales bacterium]|nr:CRISPR-associated ring nuclease [Anaerolineales bacterium]